MITAHELAVKLLMMEPDTVVVVSDCEHGDSVLSSVTESSEFLGVNGEVVYYNNGNKRKVVTLQ